jgi:hypothetical protein
MIHGLHAPLRPHEEVVLRRIALGDDSRLPEAHVRRLEQLKLVERSRHVWSLTPLGRRRYDMLEKSPLLTSAPPASVEIERILEKYSKDGSEAG